MVFNSKLTKCLPKNLIQSVNEDLSSLIYVLINHQLACLDASQDVKIKRFQLNKNLCKFFQQPFEVVEAFNYFIVNNNEDLHSKFNGLLNELNGFKKAKDCISEKFRIYWNIKWHGGCTSSLVDDLLHNNHVTSKFHIK